jgi:hypothetical protein
VARKDFVAVSELQFASIRAIRVNCFATTVCNLLAGFDASCNEFRR